ncbi:RDD family protein [Kitasatospora sp. NPDC050543]|uniref:RDD family protein n=1 Tax=Kitasatospora sp. NPDC050543 TaxID=3364054 RepID=UPI003796EDCB
MTDRPDAGGADTAIGPVPGYYPDPSIPGFVRYWGGTAWVPGTSRPAPAEGEVLEAPRFVARRSQPMSARYVPPPTAAAPETERSAAAGSVVVGPGETGPVYFDETSAGASFSMAPQAELELRRRADVVGTAQEAAGGVPGAGLGPVPAPQPMGAAPRPPAGPGGGPVPRTSVPMASLPPASAGPPASGAPVAPLASTAQPAAAQWGGYPFTQPAPELRPAAAPVAPAAPAQAPAQAPVPAPVRATAPGPALAREVSGSGSVQAPTREVQAPTPEPEPEPRLASEPPAADLDHPSAGSGWQADPRAQRGLLETGTAPRWVSWGTLPGHADAPAAGDAAAAVEAPSTFTGLPFADAAGPPAAAATPAPAPPRPRAATGGGAGASTATGTGTSMSAGTGTGTGSRTAAAAPRDPAKARTGPTGNRPARSGQSAQSASRRPGARTARPPAGLVRRLAAGIVDTGVIAIVAFAAGLPLVGSAVAHVQEKLDRARMASRLVGHQTQVWLLDGVVLGKAGVLLGILLLVGFLYEVLPTARTGQTFGKRLVGIRVVAAPDVEARAPRGRARAARTGRPGAAVRPALVGPPTLARSSARWFVRQLATLLVIGLCWPLFDRPHRRGWHDRAARTRVVRG